MELTFGWRTAVLCCAVLVALPIALGLVPTLINRTANRTLAALLCVLVGVVTPWMIGFAGFYDRWPWLTFLPVSLPLLVPPLAYLYAFALVHGRIPAGVRWLFIPGLVHFIYLFSGFLLPLSVKQRWAAISGPVVQPILAIALAIAFAVAVAAMRRMLTTYAAALRDQRSDDARFATRWLARAVGALALLFLFWATVELVDSVSPLGYDGQMPLYIGIAAVTVFLAIEGWRHALLPWPTIADTRVQPADPPAGHDWVELGAKWQQRLYRDELFKRADLTLPEAARALGTNSSYLSRACNDGLGLSFSTVVNRLRSEAVAHAMQGQPRANILDLTFDAGFASKASFNRAFAERFGTTPSAYRRRLTS